MASRPSEEDIERALRELVSTIRVGDLSSAGPQIPMLNLDRFKRSTSFGIDRVEDTLEALEDCRCAIVGKDTERALACAERAAERWSQTKPAAKGE